MSRPCLTALAALALSAALAGCAEGASTDPGADINNPADAGPADAAPDGFVPDKKDAAPIDLDGGTGEDAAACDDTQSDPQNCGECGNVCNVPGAFPACKSGKCVIDKCADEFHDLNGDPGDGCEYGCVKSKGGEEVCDNKDNDCDGLIDEGFDTDGDPKNCGSCGNECAAVNADSSCDKGKCVYTCKAGFSDLGSKTAGGCIYECPVSPTKAEVCNGLDDDCDGAIDNGQPGGDQPCEDNCPGGKCVGECKPGTTLCSGTASGLLCVGGVGPSAELCDGKDNDCNGQVDDGFDLQNDPQNCGDCGNQCQAGVKCVGGKCQFTCEPGFKDLDADPSNGCEYKCPTNPPAAAETCNGKDDDCDGVIDDSPTDVGQPCDSSCPALDPCVAAKTCTVPTSACQGKCCGVCTQGKTACSAGQKVCVAGEGAQLEICDGLDNNCDGRIDEGFNLKTDPLNCGKCNNKCMVNGAIGACVNGACTVSLCLPGFADLDKNPANGCEYACPVNPPTSESCNGKDDDCDGKVDEELPPPPNFCSQIGLCASSKPVCQGAKGFVCNYPAGVEVDASGQLLVSETLCDGIDGNCNGQVDESFPGVGEPCGAGSGACAQTSTFECSADKKSVLCKAKADPTKAVDEVCNGVDDDCDGVVDGSIAKPGTCYNGGAHPCKRLADPMIKVGTTWIYQYEASHPDAKANAVGTSLARACSRPGVLPWAPVTQTQAAAACAAVKDSAGKPMRLCSSAEWALACSLGVSGDVWSYASTPTTYNPTTCNGDDFNLNKAWATGNGAACYANQPGGKVFDLSGNVAEWTSTSFNVSGKTYFKIRGGAWDSFSTGLSCNFDFEAQPAAFQHPTVGFRCCADAAP